MMAASFEAPSKLGTGQGELDPRRMKKPQGPQRKARCGALGYKMRKRPALRARCARRLSYFVSGARAERPGNLAAEPSSSSMRSS